MADLPLPDEAVEKLVDFVLGANEQATGTMSRTAARMQVENIIGRIDRSELLARALEREEIEALIEHVENFVVPLDEPRPLERAMLDLLRAALAVKGNE